MKIKSWEKYWVGCGQIIKSFDELSCFLHLDKNSEKLKVTLIIIG